MTTMPFAHYDEHEAEPGPRPLPPLVDELAHVTPEQWDRVAAMVPRCVCGDSGCRRPTHTSDGGQSGTLAWVVGANPDHPAERALTVVPTPPPPSS